MGLERWVGDIKLFQALWATTVPRFPVLIKRWLNRLKMSFHTPEPWKKKLSRTPNFIGHVWWGWLGFHCLWMNSPLLFPSPEVGPLFPLGTVLGQLYCTLRSDCSRAVPSTGEYLARASRLIWALVPASGSSVFLWNKQEKENISFGVMQMTLPLSWSADLCPVAPWPTSCSGGY